MAKGNNVFFPLVSHTKPNCCHIKYTSHSQLGDNHFGMLQNGQLKNDFHDMVTFKKFALTDC